jgi:hypothetical protein
LNVFLEGYSTYGKAAYLAPTQLQMVASGSLKAQLNVDDGQVSYFLVSITYGTRITATVRKVKSDGNYTLAKIDQVSIEPTPLGAVTTLAGAGSDGATYRITTQMFKGPS